jgi:hypothetical protein
LGIISFLLFSEGIHPLWDTLSNTKEEYINKINTDFFVDFPKTMNSGKKKEKIFEDA